VLVPESGAPVSNQLVRIAFVDESGDGHADVMDVFKHPSIDELPPWAALIDKTNDSTAEKRYTLLNPASSRN
jgi:hypothetical protein